MKRFYGIVLAVCAAFAVVAWTIPPSVASASSAALSITPKKQYTIEPGKSVDDTLVVRNLDRQETLNLSLRVIDFTFTDDGGVPKLMLADDAPQTTWSLKPFLSLPETVTIPPTESRTIDMSVAIPDGHGAGSYYSAIVYSSSASDSGNVGLSASGVTLVFTDIPGDVTQDLKLEQFGPYFSNPVSGKSGYRYITTDQPKEVAYTLKNNGNVTEAAAGSITLKHIFGGETVISDVNPNESLALIGQTRTYTACIKAESTEVEFEGEQTESQRCATPNLWPGFYSTDINLLYGQNGNRTQDIIGAGSFWYLPVWFIIALILLLTAVGYFGWRLVSGYRTGGKKKTSRRRK